MEDEHVIRGPQTAGEGRRVTVLVSYISLANYMSRRGSLSPPLTLRRICHTQQHYFIFTTARCFT